MTTPVPLSPRRATLLRQLAAFAAAFAFGVIVFGAFVRLSNAGLSCPDWPTCYGQATWPDQQHEIASANAAFPERPFETTKAWREQVHRMLAGTLGVLVLALALIAAGTTRARLAVAAAALAAAVGVALYVGGDRTISLAFSAVALALPLAIAARMRSSAPERALVATLAVVVFQAMLGMWTVTLLLKPIVVMGHLLGGLATFALLAYAALRLTLSARATATPAVPAARADALAGLHATARIALVLVVCQIALGGWTSANYAALACGLEFPTCLGHWWPDANFRDGFVLWRGIGVNYEGGILDGPARTAIQLAHRLGALVVFGYVLGTVVAASRRGFRLHAGAIGLLLGMQIVLGIGNVKLGLPLPVATAHNGVAALLLLAVLALVVRTARDR